MAVSRLRVCAVTLLIVALGVTMGVPVYSKPAISPVVGEFDGILPCADCAGLDTRLKLVEDKPDAEKGTYFLSENYIGKSKTPFKSSGRWATVKGTPEDPAATVYVLDPDKPKKTRYYLLRADGSLLSLDRERNEIDAPFDLSLKPRAVGLANPAATNCARQGGRLEIRNDAAGGQYGVCVLADGRSCEEWAFLRDKNCVAPKQ